MKNLIILLTTLLLLAGGKELRVLVVTTNPQMHCESCEKKIKENIRFEPGVTKIVTDIKEQRVSITYNPQKTTPDKLVAAFAKIGYKAEVISDTQLPKKPAKDKK